MLDKKIFITIIIIVIAAISIGYFMLDSDTVTVDEITFKIPEGYNYINGADSYQITDGRNLICIDKKSSNNNIDACIDYYIKQKSAANVSIKISNFTANDITVFKSDSINESSIVHYWFTKNGKVYALYSYSKNRETDNLAREIISNVK